MPPPLPVESDAGSAAGEVADNEPEPVEADVDEELNDAARNADEEEDEDDDDDDAEVYVVEKILSHQNKFKDKQMRYEIKWKGYEAEADRTWETEENLAGAREILEAYWAKIGGRPVPPKKRGRQSTGSQGAKAEPAKKQKRGRKSTSDLPDPNATPEPPVGYTDVDINAWDPPAPNDNAWDPLVMNVDTIEKDSMGELWVYLVWNEKNDDGRFYRSKARLSACRQACPQKMLTFYEKHVVFTETPRNTNAEENGASTA